MADKWAFHQALPDDLDITQALIYREIEREAPAMLGGRHLVFPDGQAWWEKPDGQWQRGIMKPSDFDETRWVRVDA